MTPDAAFALEIAVVAGLVALIVAIVVASSGACRDPAAGAGPRAAAVHDVERALGADTLVTYDQARAALKGRRASSAEGKEEEALPSCAFCLSEYAGGDELVRVLPACGHFFHAECGIDRWLRTRGTCPYCRAELRPLPRPECPPMPPRAGGATVGW
ncbi:putative RING zinc finger domain superfamily protein [Panicum miliaceum]|uniref:RING-type E3 ubiquitin transferase n=1 Tax=Panicum miliaceum TaxID=4540 RepID=A0A3L6TJM6_PANMI|nr:putative RING zinc finger domain superfamily protein [Panicum miliaceum]